MGLFTAGFGTTPFAADAVAPPSAPLATSVPAALTFDQKSRSFLQNADGTMASAHPVDQEVALALGIEWGTIASAKDVGHKFRKILRASGPSTVAAVKDEVNRVLARPLARKDIALLGVDVDTTKVRGRILVFVRYKNLRTTAVQTAQVK